MRPRIVALPDGQDRVEGGGLVDSARQVAVRLALVVIAANALLAGCASTASSSSVKVQDGDPAVVNRDCKLLGTVTGRSIFGGSEAGRMDGAMQDARAKAAAMGATHIVFLTLDNSGMLNTGQATARAYRCDARSG